MAVRIKISRIKISTKIVRVSKQNNRKPIESNDSNFSLKSRFFVISGFKREILNVPVRERS